MEPLTSATSTSSTTATLPAAVPAAALSALAGTDAGMESRDLRYSDPFAASMDDYIAALEERVMRAEARASAAEETASELMATVNDLEGTVNAMSGAITAAYEQRVQDAAAAEARAGVLQESAAGLVQHLHAEIDRWYQAMLLQMGAVSSAAGATTAGEEASSSLRSGRATAGISSEPASAAPTAALRAAAPRYEYDAMAAMSAPAVEAYRWAVARSAPEVDDRFSAASSAARSPAFPRGGAAVGASVPSCTVTASSSAPQDRRNNHAGAGMATTFEPASAVFAAAPPEAPVSSLPSSSLPPAAGSIRVPALSGTITAASLGDLDDTIMSQLELLLPPPLTLMTSTLLYAMHRDGPTAEAWHAAVDGKQATLTLICVGDCWFGGYTQVGFGGADGWKLDSAAFIFTLRNPYDLPPTRFPLMVGMEQRAVQQCAAQGPIFGSDVTIGTSPFDSNTSSSTWFPTNYLDVHGKGLDTFHVAGTIKSDEVGHRRVRWVVTDMYTFQLMM